MKTILVVGGGITGLSAVYELQKWKREKQSDTRLILVEAGEKLGGKIKTIRNNGYVMETGADSIVARKGLNMSVIKELGLENEIVYNATGRSFLYGDGTLKAIPADTIFGIPTSVESLAKTSLVSPEGKVDALKDLYLRNETFTKNDSIGDFLEYFLGKEMVEKQIGPVLSGVYSGDIKELTISSTLPYLIDYKEQYGSIIRGFEANKEKFQSGSGKKFFSFKNGMDSIIDAYESHLQEVEILKNQRITNITKNNERYCAHLVNGEMLEVDSIILSIPHASAQALFSDEKIKEDFSKLKNSSLISIYLGFDVPDSVLPADGTGFITINTDELSCNACTWTSRKWLHTSESGNLLVRLFYKSSHPTFQTLKQMDVTDQLTIALNDIQKSLGITAKPVTYEITDWVENMPNYEIVHPKVVGTLESDFKENYPGVLLAGCSYYGVGIPDCIENGQEIAKQLIGSLSDS
ncbi:protoporphyrinogen oxidase [Anaerobacillus alkaliphilus]|uniref:Coproporphyrinogen III oxidase n=1 Tax=Anaerobacillus alkaliphilus TaxID=1548597 RepID=A0A4Q0VRA5_9BACI|nr:protoporphyrinogen oxidase [Anaerobacillus alkaliphilus]RXI97920.1 protoporphyrinogen oxidase [Anaerobacillus alkaliphilus]